MNRLIEKANKKMNDFAAKSRETLIFNGIKFLIQGKGGRELLFRRLAGEIKRSFRKNENTGIPYIRKIKLQYVLALIDQVKKNLDKGYLSKDFIGVMMKTMVKELFYKENRSRIIKKFKEKNGFYGPAFCVISPTQSCNLKCNGCYAVSDSAHKASLPYTIVEKLIKEMRDLVGSRFIVFSGGEPLLWRDNGKGIIDLGQRFPDIFFMFYTNGLFLNRETVKRLMQLGNMTPSISVEGFEEETDNRRGRGVYHKIHENIALLKEQGLPFGISVTATKTNIDLLLNDNFYEYWMDEVGATYMWIFHLMPIGRARETIDLMISPEQRRSLLYKWEQLLIKKNYFIADFWNSAAASDGCLAYGRGGGYFYTDWNGNINPCVFVPYYKDNIYDLYKNGKTIADAICSDYFTRGREWQNKNNFINSNRGNLFAPCSFRDHHAYFRKHILNQAVKPADKNAREALRDPKYYEKMVEFGKKINKLTKYLWKERVL